MTLFLEARNRTVKYEDYQSRMQLCEAQVSSPGMRVPFLRILDIEQVFSSAGVCVSFIKDQLLYTENNHLRVAGSRRVAPLILKAALEWVRQVK